MSEENKRGISSAFGMISTMQRAVFNIILFTIPWFFVPLPYDSTEKIKSIAFIFLAALLILLEIIKWIWEGKVSIVKSSFDKVFLLLLISFLISTVFARDMWISLWGYDGRMGTGFLVILVLFLFFYVARGFLQKKTEITRSLSFLLGGIAMQIVLSMLSVMKIDVLGWVPHIKEFFLVGLPLTFSFQEIMLIAGLGIFLSIFLLVNHLQEKKYQSIIFPVLVLGISLISIPIFSVNQGALIPILLFVVLIPVCLILWVKLEKSLKILPVLLFVISALVLVFSIGFQYESFRTSILGDSFETLTPISLGSDISWMVSSSSIVDDFLRGLVGLGNDSFALAYNRFRPATEATIALGNTSFTSGSNEVFTTLANRGLIGVIVWALIGIVYIKTLIKELTSKKEKSTMSFLLGLTVLFVFVGSVFVPFSFLLYFLLFSLTLLWIVYVNKEERTEEFLLKFWAVNVGDVSKDMNKTMEGINWFFTILVTLLITSGLVILFVRSASDVYIVRAESYNIEQTRRYENFEGEIPFADREAYLIRMSGYYDRALRYNRTDPYINRKSSLIAVEIIGLLSEQFTDAAEEEQEALLSEVTLWRNVAIDLSREAISTSNLTYANWNTRSSVYLGLISVGLSDYAEDALMALQNCINLNPLDYDSYYKAGQIFMIQEKYDRALAAFNSVLNINGQHVPSLVLAARILQENGDTENAIAYLQAAKQILEVNELDIGDIYQSIVDSISELGGDIEVGELEEVEELEEEVVLEEETQEEFNPIDPEDEVFD